MDFVNQISGLTARTNLSNKRFLVVDDFRTMRRIVTNLVRELGADDIVEADDGVDAMKLLETAEIDFIISDWNMPNMGGLDLLRSVRAGANRPGTPFLLITAEARTETIVEAARAGADGCIVKPFTASMLADKVETILKRRRRG